MTTRCLEQGTCRGVGMREYNSSSADCDTINLSSPVFPSSLFLLLFSSLLPGFWLLSQLRLSNLKSTTSLSDCRRRMPKRHHFFLPCSLPLVQTSSYTTQTDDGAADSHIHVVKRGPKMAGTCSAGIDSHRWLIYPSCRISMTPTILMIPRLKGLNF